ncbi:MAG: ribosome recycling factor [Bacteroidales bacterium]|nr:ribosome recycling factor [Bacteroidales bacterium]
MEEEVQLNFELTEEKMDKAIQHFEEELVRVRAGKASPSMLDGISVDYYGVVTPLNQVSNINTPDAKTIMVQPWEKNMIEPIEKAIMQANIGLNPANNGEVIRIIVPILTEERRKNLVKQIRGMAEITRVSIRNARHAANDEIKRMQKDGLSEDLAKIAENDIQEITKTYSEKIEKVLEAKEKDIMTV